MCTRPIRQVTAPAAIRNREMKEWKGMVAPLIREISEKVKNAAHRHQKIAMFHLMVLLHADELKDYDAEGFCAEIGVRKSYAIEFRKMIALREVMRENSIQLIEPSDGMIIRNE